MFDWWKNEKTAPDPEQPKPRGVFSTHWSDSAGMGVARLASAAWAVVVNGIAGKLPVSTPGTMDAATDTGSSLKNSFSTAQPNIPDALMLWYASQTFIGVQMCAILAQNWLIMKACAGPARDALRNGYDIVTSDGEKLAPEVLNEMRAHDDKFRVLKSAEEFLRMGRIFGVRVAFFKVDSDDPDYYEKPFNLDGVRANSYRGIVQVDPYWIAPMLDGAAASDPSSQHFYEPTWWQINGKKYHRTHLVIFRNCELPDILKPSYIYGGVPVPQQIMERVYAAERTANEGPLLAMTKRTTVMKTDLELAYTNKDQFTANIAEWVAMRDNQQIKVVDRDDDVQQTDTALGDLDSVIMTQYQLVAAAANYPATKLMGTSPKGFGAAGEYEIESYHEFLEGLQTHDVDPLLRRHHQLVVRSFILPRFGVDIDARVAWRPLDTPTAKDLADTNLIKAQTDAALIATGAIDAYDIRTRLIDDDSSGYNGIESAERPDDDLSDGAPETQAE